MTLPNNLKEKLMEREFITSVIMKAVGIAALLGFVTPEQQTSLTGLWNTLLNNLDMLVGTILLIVDQLIYTKSRTEIKKANTPDIIVQKQNIIKTGEGGEMTDITQKEIQDEIN